MTTRSSPSWLSWSKYSSALSSKEHKNADRKKEALRLGRELLRGTKYEDEAL